MRRRPQLSTAALMEVIFLTGVLLALLKDPDSRSVLAGLANGGLLVVVLTAVCYVCLECILLVVRVSCWLRSRKGRPERVSAVNNPTSLIGN
jgi:hypothetical protein